MQLLWNRLKIPILRAAAQLGLYSHLERQLGHQLMDRLLRKNNYYFCNVQSSWTVENGASELETLYWLPSPSHPGAQASSPCARVPMRAKLLSDISFPCHFFQGSTDNVFLAPIINLIHTFVPVHALHVAAPFPSHTAEEPVSDSFPSLFSVSPFGIPQGSPVDSISSTIQQLNSFKLGRTHYRFLLCILQDAPLRFPRYC